MAYGNINVPGVSGAELEEVRKEKADKAVPAAEGNLAALDASGNLVDSGIGVGTDPVVKLNNVDIGGNAETANKLKTARTILTKLDSTSPDSFDGSENVTPGVAGILPLRNGGTGQTFSAAPAYAIVRMSSDPEAYPYLYYTPTGIGVFYATGENGAPKFGIAPLSAGGCGADLSSVPSGAVIAKSSGSYLSYWDKVPVNHGGTGAATPYAGLTNLGGMALSAQTTIATDSDLDDFTTPGNYMCVGDSNAQSLANAPFNYAFRLNVGYNYCSASYVYQEATEIHSGRRAYRQYAPSTGTWGSWKYKDWRVLWTNSSPTSAFAAQTLTISGLSSYNLFAVVARRNTTSALISSALVYVPGTAEAGAVLSEATVGDSYGALVRQRNVYITRSANTVEFTTGWMGGEATATDGSNVLIPLYILGTTV